MIVIRRRLSQPPPLPLLVRLYVPTGLLLGLASSLPLLTGTPDHQLNDPLTDGLLMRTTENTLFLPITSSIRRSGDNLTRRYDVQAFCDIASIHRNNHFATELELPAEFPHRDRERCVLEFFFGFSAYP